MLMNVNRAILGDASSLDSFALKTLLAGKLRINHVTILPDLRRVADALGSSDCDIAIIDISLPGFKGMADIRALRHINTAAKFAVTARSADRSMILAALDAGAHGFVPKSLSIQDIAGAFTHILAGHIYVPDDITDFQPSVVQSAARISNGSVSAQLTNRQLEVMKCLAVGKSNKEIARQLGISESTVKVHLASAFRQLNVKNRVSAAAALAA